MGWHGVGQVVATPITGSQRAAQASKARSPDAASLAVRPHRGTPIPRGGLPPSRRRAKPAGTTPPVPRGGLPPSRRRAKPAGTTPPAPLEVGSLATSVPVHQNCEGTPGSQEGIVSAVAQRPGLCG